MKTAQVISRKLEFPDAILEMGQQNALIDRVISRYAHGGFATMQDALVEMVVILESQGSDYRAQLLKLVESSTTTIIMPQS